MQKLNLTYYFPDRIISFDFCGQSKELLYFANLYNFYCNGNHRNTLPNSQIRVAKKDFAILYIFYLFY